VVAAALLSWLCGCPMCSCGVGRSGGGAGRVKAVGMQVRLNGTWRH
jgi:hypothetical protein